MHRRESPPKAVKSARFGDSKASSANRTNIPGQMQHNALADDDTLDHATLIAKKDLLERDLERRQESYVARERAYKLRIEELEEELSNQRREKTGWMQADSKMSNLKQMQGQILKNVELVQDRTAKILQEQERDLLRAFRARLFDVQTELEKEKSKKDDGAGAWIERSRQLEAEVDWAKEVADRLERVNQTLVIENTRLKSQFASQEEDRNFLIKQLVAVKKDNARLRAEYTAIETENTDLKHQIKTTAEISSQMNGRGSVKAGDADDRYKDVNARLRRLLAEERKSLQTVRQNYALELKARTEMELLLRQCVEDVRKEIARRNIEAAQFSVGGGDLSKLYARAPGLIPVEEFAQEDRERALELLLSQERVVTLLYAKTFPVTGKTKSAALALEGSSTGGLDEEDLAAIAGTEFSASERPKSTGGLGADKLPAVSSARPLTGSRIE